MIKAIVFDFGGVLVRTESQAGRQKWENVLGLAPGELSREVFDSQAAIQASLGKLPERAIWEHVAETYHLTSEQARELEIDFWSGDVLDEDLVGFLRSLRPRFKTAILSNAWSGARLNFREKFELETAVDLIVISAEEGLAKPDAQIYALLAHRLEILPGEAVFVDDFLVNVEAARAAGFQAIQFRETRQAIDEIRRLIEEPAAS